LCEFFPISFSGDGGGVRELVEGKGGGWGLGENIIIIIVIIRIFFYQKQLI
jgi:hypothetical protein